MKKISLYILFLLSSTVAFGQLDRSKYPEPGPAPQINIGDPATFTLPNGLKVFVVENHKLPRVSYTLVLDRDPILEGEKAGMLSLFGEVLLGGTNKLSKDQLDEAIDHIGGRISVSSRSASASSLKKYNDQLLDLFSDVLFNSSFSQAELDKLKKQSISNLAANKDDPSSISGVVSNAVLYGKDHPYGENETEETIEHVQIDDLKQYYNTYFRPNIGYLAIVGDITVDEAKSLVNQYFGAWEKANVPTHDWSVPSAPQGNQVALVNRATSQQTVLNILYPFDLKPNSPDVIAASVVSNVLGGGSSGRLFLNLREDKGYTYGAYGSISPGKLVATLQAGASVGTHVTDSAINEFLYELDRLDKKTITQEELDIAKASLAGSFARSLEQPGTIANFAINSEIQKLPKDYYKDYLKNLDAIDLSKANEIAAKYITPENLYITVVGKGDELEEKLARFGTISRYTVTGDPEVKIEITDANVTAESIVEKYLEAIGGRTNLEAVKTIKQVSVAEVQGMSLDMELLVDKEKAIAVQNVKMGGNVISKVTITEDGAKGEMMGRTEDLPEEMAAPMKSYLDVFPELGYAKRGVTLELDGIATVNGEQAYKVKTIVGGSSSVDFFSIESGLKLQTDNPTSGTITYKDYKEFDGILFPTISEMSMQGMPLKPELKEVVINQPVSVD